MTISLPESKRIKIKSLLNTLLNTEKCSIRFLARVIGSLVSACPAIKYDWLNTKALERFKSNCLSKYKQNFDVKVRVPKSFKFDLKWWLKVIEFSFNNIRSDSYHLEIFSYSSLSGWGASCGTQVTYGWWPAKDQQKHINFLELKSAFLAVVTFAKNFYRYSS